MSDVLRIAASCVVAAMAIGVVIILLYASLRDVIRERRKWMSQKKRLSVTLGQQLEVEYQVTPESREFAAGVEVQRVFAYSGAVRVEVTALVRACGQLPHIESQCENAEGVVPSIPF